MQVVQHINGCQLTSEADHYGIREWMSLFIGFSYCNTGIGL